MCGIRSKLYKNTPVGEETMLKIIRIAINDWQRNGFFLFEYRMYMNIVCDPRYPI